MNDCLNNQVLYNMMQSYLPALPDLQLRLFTNQPTINPDYSGFAPVEPDSGVDTWYSAADITFNNVGSVPGVGFGISPDSHQWTGNSSATGLQMYGYFITSTFSAVQTTVAANYLASPVLMSNAESVCIVEPGFQIAQVPGVIG